ncbi:hypothetical protein, partial [Mycolicibacterium austroafricanum]
MTTYCEETISLRPGLAEETVRFGAMPLAQSARTVRTRVLDRPVHRPDPRHHAHRADPRRHDRTKVLHEPTKRLALHEHVTKRLA